MRIKDCMKHNVFYIRHSATLADAVKMFCEHHIGTLPVVDDQERLIGILQLRDLLSLVMPDFVRLVDDFDFVQDFGAVENRQPDEDELRRPVSAYMQDPLSVDENCGLLRASSVLHHDQVYDLTVVDSDGRLVGIASRVDIALAFLSGWNVTQAGTG
ncbi:MAG: CBS domain-containing protein [Anaerolineales bacterium]|nr:CBS domain-containing protein [Anaerolineales bacterium]